MSRPVSSPKPYNLTLYSYGKPDRPDGIFCSLHMVAFGLWDEFSRLPHVTLQYENTAAPPINYLTDFALIHDCFDSPIYGYLPTIRQITRHKIMGIMESAFASPLMDHFFTWLPQPDEPRAEHVPFPCIRSLIDAHNGPKRPGSILLDHTWILDKDTDRDWCGRLYQWLEPMLADGRVIAQMHRGGHEAAEHFPPWLTVLPEICYPVYLDQTASFETFILTHPGSYEHSIIDMVARGIRVLVPKQDGWPFCSPSIVNGLNLQTFGNREELLALLTYPPSSPVPADTTTDVGIFTDMPEIVARIDKYAQEALS